MTDVSNRALERSPRLTLAHVAAITDEATGKPVATARCFAGGNDHEVWEALTIDGRSLVLRAGVGGGLRPDQEAWALKWALDSGVPVPEVLRITCIQADQEELPVLVETRADGRALSEVLSSLNTAEVRSITTEMGAILARLHSRNVGGFYRRHSDGRWDFRDLDSLVASALRGRRAESALLEQAGLSREEINQAMQLLPEALDAAGLDGPVLCHGDLGPDHVFVDDDLKITSLIDFGLAAGGRPFDDLVVLSRNWPEVDLDALREGYGPAWFWEGLSRRLALGKVPLLIGYVAYCVRVGRSDDARRDADQLRAALKSAAG